MEFNETPLAGAFVIEMNRFVDERGFFSRTFCRKEFSDRGLCSQFVQSNVSYNIHKYTMRGMHFQRPPFGEVKLIRCTQGVIFDVIVDIRPESKTFKKWFSVELSALNHRMLYVPAGFAHGFMSLTEASEVFYEMGEVYHPESVKGISWKDPLLAIPWPTMDPVVSTGDQSLPTLSEAIQALG